MAKKQKKDLTDQASATPIQNRRGGVIRDRVVFFRYFSFA